MRKFHLSSLTRFLYILFAACTLVVLTIVFGHFEGRSFFYFLIGYFVLALFMALYIPTVIFINSRRLNWVTLRKRLIRLLILFILLTSANYVLDYILRPARIDLLRECVTAFGIALGVTFTDIVFFNKK